MLSSIYQLLLGTAFIFAWNAGSNHIQVHGSGPKESLGLLNVFKSGATTNSRGVRKVRDGNTPNIQILRQILMSELNSLNKRSLDGDLQQLFKQLIQEESRRAMRGRYNAPMFIGKKSLPYFLRKITIPYIVAPDIFDKTALPQRRESRSTFVTKKSALTKASRSPSNVHIHTGLN